MRSTAATTIGIDAPAVLAENGRTLRRPACFASHIDIDQRDDSRHAAIAPLILQFDTRPSELLAMLLPVLLCGEESASLAFARIANSESLSDCAIHQARRIEADERTHEYWLTQIKSALPPPPEDQQLVRAARRFFVGLAERDLGRHFARIAALDSAVCILLGALRRRKGFIDKEPTLSDIFSRIHRDEARHVLIARDFAMKLAGTAQVYEIAIDTRDQLVKLLTFRASALEALLHINPDKLFSRLRNPARELFA